MRITATLFPTHTGQHLFFIFVLLFCTSALKFHDKDGEGGRGEENQETVQAFSYPSR